MLCFKYRGADKSLARPGRKQARKHVRDARDFNNIETRAVIKFIFSSLQDKAPKGIHAFLTEILTCFRPGRVKDLSALLYIIVNTLHKNINNKMIKEIHIYMPTDVTFLAVCDPFLLKI